jgi:hypothetical protein
MISVSISAEFLQCAIFDWQNEEIFSRQQTQKITKK